MKKMFSNLLIILVLFICVSCNEKPTTKDTTLYCTLSIDCSTILENIDSFDKDKLDILPEDGVILAYSEVQFYDGESVFDVLKRETKNRQIHLEFTDTPVYNSAYIEGISNIYEFDCGELSGWMYSVNDMFPNHGCSQYKLSDGDRIELLYTCNLGKDIGGNASGRNGFDSHE